MKKITQINNQIKKELQEKGLKPNDFIDYEYFLELYEPYKGQISQKDFAQILGISAQSYSSLDKHRVIIWKTRNSQVSEEMNEKVRNELQQKGVKPDMLINYEYFLELYEPYKEILNEKQFATILEINSCRFTYLKKTGTRTTVWRRKLGKLSEADKNTIIEELKKCGLKPGNSINYTIFLQFYENYKERMSESQFADVLGIKYTSFENMKNKGLTLRIWNQEQSRITAEERKAIEKEIETKGFSDGSRINYLKFLELYEPYKERMTEIEFASILDISQSNYYCIKTKKQNAVIWKNRRKATNKEKIESIEKDLKKRGLKIGTRIYYDDFRELYEPYHETISEEEFAKILRVSKKRLETLKTKNKSVIVWTNKQRKITEDDKERIRQELEEKGIKNGRKVNYKFFLELYEPYKEYFSEKEFALVLGISHASYPSMRGKNTNIIVNYNKEEVERVRHLLSESRYYSKEELENISRTYDISMEQIILGNKKSIPYGEGLKRVLEEKNRIYIGKKQLSKKCIIDNQEQLKAIIKKWTLGICRKYQCQHCAADIAASCLEYVMTNCGDIEANFEEEFIKFIPYKITTYIKNACFNELHRARKLTVAEKRYTSNKGTNETMQIQLRDETVDVQEAVLDKLRPNVTKEKIEEEHYISTLMKYIKKGIENDEAIRRAAAELNVDQNEMIRRMQDYLIGSKKVVKTNGRILYEREK